jgi:hydroxymethylglutaryl-CoA lyase
MKEIAIVNEVGARDGLQNQAKVLSCPERVQLIEALAHAGLRHIEVGSFVSPKAVPCMAGTDAVMASVPAIDGMRYSVLVPNMKGFDLARASGARNYVLMLSATDTFSRRNIGMDMNAAFDVSCRLIARCREEGFFAQACISVAFECPYEGRVHPRVVEELTARLFENGAQEVMIADTIGAAAPAQVKSMLSSLARAHGADHLSVHFHDTRAMAVANCYASLEAGIRRFDSAIGGMGGCPFAPGATGNVATEDVVMLLEQSGFDTGVDMPALIRAAQLAQRLTGNCPGPRNKMWLAKQYGASAGVDAACAA